MPDDRQSHHHSHDKGYRELLSSKVDRIIGANPWEVDVMITNLEIALEEME
ncbi:hypothetical protein [Desulfofundulus thermosubterraneus]|uniref:Uncharacterized protein n=1 Tax=Desulfofundulus thermosubterraneus DSM 16057 TaxID=1121432 RepID=A0A1M6GK39_9FIRM|nr:hypothetical protein [Desulfofundulus thermosubterraneus]SHJ10337.1 hypothetical protein SAMN02745219_01765 [Desulfofundulus thermosubterraneus DSM 16057]